MAATDPLRPGRLDWRWMLAGAAVLVAGNLGAWHLLAARLRQMVDRDQVGTAFTIAAATPLTIYFVGGLLVARMSRGAARREPAVAALVSVVAVFVVHLLFAGMVNLFGLLIGAPFCFGAAYLGGCLGERWQRGSSRSRTDPTVTRGGRTKPAGMDRRRQ